MLDLTRRPPRRLLDRALLVALTALLCLFASTEHRAAELQPVDAGQMKAVFVVNFLRFVEWPSANVAPAPAPLVVAVLGDRALIESLRDYAAGQSVSGHAIEVKAVERPEDARGAHMLFIGSSESANLPAIVKMAETSALLTVGDTDGYARAGVILNLYTVDQRVRIEANPVGRHAHGPAPQRPPPPHRAHRRLTSDLLPTSPHHPTGASRCQRITLRRVM